MSKIKYCPECKSDKVIKKGMRSRAQKYHCNSCLKWFQSARQTNRKIISIMDQLTFKKTIQI